MSSGLLPDHIGPLVDRLRSGDHLPISLPDVAAVTEVLMRSLESYFKSIDLTLYKECQELADYIDEARSEITSLSPTGEDSAGIPRAGKELDAIVEATESATDTIMQAAEDLMSFETESLDDYKDHLNTEVMKIFEACSFQDITGQRISKVVKTLNHVEDRVGKLISILGITHSNNADGDVKSILDSDTAEIDDDGDLLNGPALSGEGIDQSEIDSLLDGGFDQQPVEEQPDDNVNDPVAETVDEVVEDDQSQSEPNVETSEEVSEEIVEEVAEEVSEEVVEEVAETSVEEVETIEEVAKTDHTEQKVHEKVDVIPEKKEAANSTNKAPNGNEKTSQDDIDSLFG